MSVLLVAAIVIAALNLARIAATGADDPLGIALNVGAIVMAVVFLVIDRNERTA